MTFIIQSDWVVKIFVAMSIAVLTIVLERLYELGRTQYEIGRIASDVKAAIRPDSPLQLLQGVDGRDERRVDLALNLFEQRLRRYATPLGLIAVLAPMLGLVGTFLGVFQVFEGVSEVGLSDPKAIAGGIRKVLVDTVAGLSIAIPAMAAFKSFEVWAVNLSLKAETLLLSKEKATHGAA
jgi:biopolymer transport protein ExbB